MCEVFDAYVFQPFAIFAAQSRRHPESGLRIGQFVDPGGGIAIGAVAVNDYLYLLTINNQGDGSPDWLTLFSSPIYFIIRQAGYANDLPYTYTFNTFEPLYYCSPFYLRYLM
jgi:hypothetical protein